MAGIRKHMDSFTMVNNHIIYNREISYKAKGLYLQMISLPDGWNFSEKGMSGLASGGLAIVRSALKELEEHGYLIRERARNEKGHLLENTYNIFDKPYDLVDGEFIPKGDNKPSLPPAEWYYENWMTE